MSSIFTNYGYWDGVIKTTNAPDGFSSTPHNFAGRAAYEFKKAAEEASIALGRMETRASDAVRWKLEDDKMEELKQAARDCEMAIARVLEELEARKAARDAADHYHDLRRDEVAA